MSKVHTFSFALSSDDFVQMLIAEYGFPKNSVLTRMERPFLNQDAWIINLHSPEFPEHGDLDTLSTARFTKGYKWKKED